MSTNPQEIKSGIWNKGNLKISNRYILRFLKFGTIDTLNQIIFLECFPVNCRMFSNIPDH